MTARSKFLERLAENWLPSFCNARSEDFQLEGFVKTSAEKVSEFDAYWFLEAVDSGFVAESGGFFVSARSAAKEQIFWSGKRVLSPRRISLWLEPVISLGAVARLVQQYGWPLELVGTQTKYPWPFDLACYVQGSEEERLVCEVKKSTQEIEILLRHTIFYGREEPPTVEPISPKERNAYRKVKGLRLSNAELFWALGPEGNGHLFSVRRNGEARLVDLTEVDESRLAFDSNALSSWGVGRNLM